jgi:hypothetical protein
MAAKGVMEEHSVTILPARPRKEVGSAACHTDNRPILGWTYLTIYTTGSIFAVLAVERFSPKFLLTDPTVAGLTGCCGVREA